MQEGKPRCQVGIIYVMRLPLHPNSACTPQRSERIRLCGERIRLCEGVGVILTVFRSSWRSLGNGLTWHVDASMTLSLCCWSSQILRHEPSSIAAVCMAAIASVHTETMRMGLVPPLSAVI